MTIDEYIGMRLAHLKTTKQISSEWLCSCLEISQEELETIEQGQQRLTEDQLMRLVAVFGVAPSYFFEGFSGPLPDANVLPFPMRKACGKQ